jgi:hypothetical protein
MCYFCEIQFVNKHPNWMSPHYESWYHLLGTLQTASNKNMSKIHMYVPYFPRQFISPRSKLFSVFWFQQLSIYAFISRQFKWSGLMASETVNLIKYKKYHINIRDSCCCCCSCSCQWCETMSLSVSTNGPIVYPPDDIQASLT